MVKTRQIFNYVRDRVCPAPVYDFWCKEFHLLSRREHIVARVIKVIPETRDAVSIWLKPNSNFKGVLPGQHVNVGVEVDGHLVSRSYSVSRVKGRYFRITARRVNNGKVSHFLNQHARKGMFFSIGEAYGEVTVERFHQKPTLFLASGIGITPIISMLESWAASFRKQPVQLVYWGRRSQDLAFVDRLKNLAQKNAWFEFKILETQFLDRNDDGTPKLIAETSSWFYDIKDRLTHFDAFACGSDGFVNQVKERISPLVNNFHFESFTPAFVSAEPGVPVRVSLTKQHRTVTIPSGVNILSALEQAGVTVMSGCRRGTCNTCSCKKMSGIVQHQKDLTIHESTDAGFKPCTHAALSDITLEL